MSRSLSLSVALLVAVLCVGFGANADGVRDLNQAVAAVMGLRVGQSPDFAIQFWSSVSWIGGGWRRYVLVILVAIFVAMRRNRLSGVLLALTVLCSNLASDSLKMLFAHPRPQIVPHLDHAGSFAFPSGHTTSAAALWIMLALIVPTPHRKAALAAAGLFALFMGWSRVMVGVHWPSDVIGGWLLGAAFAVLGASFIQRTARPIP